ncbi:hypothetical protein ACLMJK_003066 [Lecanora helva]
MAVDSQVPYRIRQATLESWLQKNFGKDSQGRPRYSFKCVKDKNGVHFWLVTGPRAISDNEKEAMKIEELEKDKARNMFAAYDE